MSHFRDIPKSNDNSAARHDAGTQHSCFEYLSTYDKIVMSTRSSDHVVPETMKVRRKLEELVEEAADRQEEPVLETSRR